MARRRAALALLQCAKAWALLEGRDYVLPDDVQAVLEPVAAHRLQAATDSSADGAELVQHMLSDVAVLA